MRKSGGRCNSGTLCRQGFTWVSGIPTMTGTGDSGRMVDSILKDWGVGWYRLGFGFEADSTNIDFELDVDRANSSATTSIEYFGGQIEEGSYPTSLIPTYGSAVTRAVDSAQITSASALIGQTAGTIYFETILNGTDKIPFTISDGTSRSEERRVGKECRSGWSPDH